MRVVLDVNVWVSGLLWRGIPGLILDLSADHEITVLISQSLFQELIHTLSKPKLQNQIRALGVTVQDLLNTVRELSVFCGSAEVTCPQLRDPDDLIVLGAAQAAEADVIITGDKDLLVLANFEGIKILSPQDFWDCYLGQKLR